MNEIKFEQLVVKKNDKDGATDPINFSFDKRIVALDEDKKDVFDILSFRFQSIESGYISIGGKKYDKEIIESGTGLFFLAINLKKICRLLCVFDVSINEKETKNNIIKIISSRKNVASKTTEEKTQKLNTVLQDLISLNCLYVLLDGGNELNYENSEIISECLVANDIQAITLRKKKEEVKEVAEINEGKDDDKGTNRISINLSSAVFSEIKSTEIFFFVFPLIFVVCLAVCVVSFGDGNIARGIITVMISLLCISMHFYNSLTVRSGTTNDLTRTVIEAISSLSSLAGCAIGCLVVFILAKTNVLFEMSDFGPPLIITLVVLSIFCFTFPFFTMPIGNLFRSIKLRFPKNK